jgi:hypothetical protein
MRVPFPALKVTGQYLAVNARLRNKVGSATPLRKSTRPKLQGPATFPAILGEHVDVLAATGARTEAALEKIVGPLAAAEQARTGPVLLGSMSAHGAQPHPTGWGRGKPEP